MVMVFLRKNTRYGTKLFRASLGFRQIIGTLRWLFEELLEARGKPFPLCILFFTNQYLSKSVKVLGEVLGR